MLAGRITHHLDQIHHGHGLALQQVDQLGNRDNAEHIDASDEFRLSARASGRSPRKTMPGRKACSDDREVIMFENVSFTRFGARGLRSPQTMRLVSSL